MSNNHFCLFVLKKYDFLSFFSKKQCIFAEKLYRIEELKD